ncbi:MAG: AMP-binding protein [Verrucomicrobiia bacterium]
MKMTNELSQQNNRHYNPAAELLLKLLRFILILILKVFYRFEARNLKILNTEGPVLLVSNHVSWIDWLLIGVLLNEDWKFVTSKTTANLSWFHRFIMVNRRTFPIDPVSPYSAKKIAECLKNGGRLVLFPEGRMSRTGNIMKFYEGVGFLLHTTKTKVILCRIRGAERTVWAKHNGWKKLFYPISLHFYGPVIPPKFESVKTSIIRSRLTQWLMDLMIKQHFDVEMQSAPQDIPDAICESARQRPGFVVFEDAQENKLSLRRFCVGAALLSKEFKKSIDANNIRVGIILPNVCATPLVIVALWKEGKTPTILNYSSGLNNMIKCAKIADIKYIITSRIFIERLRIQPVQFTSEGFHLLYIEDIKEHISDTAKILALFKSLFTVPCLKPPGAGSLADKTAVILFTSGSEGEPKGVELTHSNILANIRQLLAVVDLRDSDRLFSCLPLFHSFGLTIGAFVPLTRCIYSFLYISPLHYRLAPTLFYEKECTIMFSTNTFLNGYLRRAHPYDFHNARLVFAGAEKLSESTADNFARYFGIRVLEGYGVTECSPVVCVNTPLCNKFNTVGRFLPGIEWRIEPVEGINSSNTGRLYVKGPNIMRGYINPEANAKFKSLDGWYDTGDIVRVDEHGFVQILGRLKRFAKISGEMISLTAIEEALNQAIQAKNTKGQVAIINLQDQIKGERLIGITNDSTLTIQHVRQTLKSAGFSPLAFPSELIYIKDIPKLGSGKTDYITLKQMIEKL